MANDVALFTGGGMLQLPEHLRGVEVDEQTKKLAGGAGGLRISIRGSVFRMINNGEEISKNEDRAMNVVIVASSPDTARTYYEDGYVEGEKKPPTCWSADGKSPDANVQNKQSSACATCPQNVAGSGDKGTRACRYSRNLAVVLEGDIGGKVFKLNLPSQSIFGGIENNIMPLQAYGKKLVAAGIPVSAVVTEMRFDTDSATPKLGFKAVRYLSAVEYEEAKRQGQTPEAVEATKTTAYEYDAGGASSLGIAGKPAGDATKDAAAATASEPVASATTTNGTVSKRTRAKPSAAKSVVSDTATVEDATRAVSGDSKPVQTPLGAMTPEQVQAMMLQMQAIMAAQEATKTSEEPVVVHKNTAANQQLPESTAAMLAQWSEDEE